MCLICSHQLTSDCIWRLTLFARENSKFRRFRKLLLITKSILIIENKLLFNILVANGGSECSMETWKACYFKYV